MAYVAARFMSSLTALHRHSVAGHPQRGANNKLTLQAQLAYMLQGFLMDISVR
jgi:hypothetical protein